MLHLTGNKTVDAIGQIHLEGNIIPHKWFEHVRFENGKPDLTAIIILSEIVYWHRPIYLKDEVTGQFVGVKKRFKSDLLQRSYDSFSEQFGITKRQAKEAIFRLEEMGLIKRHFRTIQVNNTKLNNVLFIELIHSNVIAMTLQSSPSDVETIGLSHPNVTPLTLERQTNTEITTEITTENIKDTVVRNENVQIPFESIVNYLNQKAGTNFKHTTNKTRSLIKARFNEGFQEEHFKIVIDKKVSTWLHNEKMNKFLRPETLFGTKFESYLNEKVGAYNAKNQRNQNATHFKDGINF